MDSPGEELTNGKNNNNHIIIENTEDNLQIENLETQ